MNATDRNESYPYRAVRKDLLLAITTQFAPARLNTALVAAAKALASMDEDTKRRLAIEAEAEVSSIASERAARRFKGWKPTSPAQS